MKQEINLSQFMDSFRNMGRENQFSYNGLTALYNYLEDFENFELDVIGLCCDFCEYENIEEYLKDYNTDIEKEDFAFYEDNETEKEEFEKAVFEEIENKTTLIKWDCGFIIGNC